MKKVISLLLAVVMLVAAVPMGFAIPSAAASSAASGPVSHLTTLDAIKSTGKVLDNGILLYNTFENWSKTAADSNYSSATNADLYSSSSAKVWTCQVGTANDTNGTATLDTTDGNTSMRFNAKNGSIYHIVRNNTAEAVTVTKDSAVADYIGQSIIYQMDYKQTGTGYSGEFMSIYTKSTTGSQLGVKLLSADGGALRVHEVDGSDTRNITVLKDANGNKILVKSETYNTIAVLLNPSLNRFWVIVNGTVIGDDGYKFLTKAEMKTLVDPITGETYLYDSATGNYLDKDGRATDTPTPYRYLHYDIRSFPGRESTGGAYFDNTMLYYVDQSYTCDDYLDMLKPAGKSELSWFTSRDRALATGKVLTNGFILDTNYDMWDVNNAVKGYNTTTTSEYAYGEQSKTLVQLLDATTDTCEIEDLGNGNKALKSLPNAPKTHYLLIMGSFSGFKGNSFIYEMDYKPGALKYSGGIVRLRDSAGKYEALVVLSGKGELCTKSDANVLKDENGNSFKLSVDEFTKISVLVNPQLNRYWVMANGKVLGEDGYQFLTTANTEYELTQLRSHSGTPGFTVDNTRLYFVDDTYTYEDYLGMFDTVKATPSDTDNANGYNYYFDLPAKLLAANPELTAKLTVNGKTERIKIASAPVTDYDVDGDGKVDNWVNVKFTVPSDVFGMATMTLYQGATVFATDTFKIDGAITDIIAPEAGDTYSYKVCYASGAYKEFTVTEGYKNAVANVNGYKLSLKGDIGVKGYLDIPEFVSYDKLYVKFTVDGSETVVSFADAEVSEAYGYGFERLVNATQMSSKVTLELYYGNVLLISDTYSVAEYAKEILSNSAYAEAQPVVKAMLNYGSLAQDYFGVTAADPADGYKYTTELDAVTKDVITDLSVNKASGTVAGLTYAGSWLELRSTPVLYHSFEVIGDISDYSFKLGSKTLTPISMGGNKYAIAVTEVYPQAMANEYTVTVIKGSESYSITYNAMNYLKLAYGSSELKPLVSALYLFYDEANMYFSKITASVLKVKDGKSGIVTIVHDDGTLATARYLNSALGQYGFVGTVGMVADYVICKSGNPEFVDNGDGTATYIETENTVYVETEWADDWKEIIADGNLEIASHTQTHRWYGIDDNASSGTFQLSSSGTMVTYEFLDGHMTNEIVGSAERLRLVFADQNQRVLTYVITGWPAANNGRTEAAIKMIAENYISARSSGQGVNIIGDINDYHTLKEMAIYDTTTVKDMTDYVDSVVDAEAWGIYCFHVIKAGSAESGAYQGNVDQLLKYMHDNNVWGASLEQATLYVKEYENSSLDVKLAGNAIKVTLTDTLDNDIYNMALTVRVDIPTYWGNATATFANGDTAALDVLTDENGTNYVMVNIVPDSGTVTIEGAM